MKNPYILKGNFLLLSKTIFTEASIIEKNLTNPRNYGISDIQSTSSLRNSSKPISFSKEKRFKFSYKNAVTDNFYDIQSIKSHKTTSFGYGNRVDMRYIKGKGVPSPDTYNIPNSLKTNVVPTLKSRHTDIFLSKAGNIPSPCEYNIQYKKTNLECTLKFRHGMYYESDTKMRLDNPSPQQYKPSYTFTEPNRYSNITFGSKGKSILISKNTIKNPGPGSYNLPSIFDLNRKYKPSIS